MEIIKNLSFAEYQKLDGINMSSLKEIQTSPLQYKHRQGQARADTSAMSLGRAAHTAVLEPDKLLLDYVVYQGGTRRGKKWDEYKAANEGRTILTQNEMENMIGIRDAAKRHSLAKEWLSNGDSEVSIQWADKDTGLLCKGRIDRLTDDDQLIDLKTTSKINPDEFRRSVVNFGYHLQLAFYFDGLEAITGDRFPMVRLIAVQSAPPYDVVCYCLPWDVIKQGRREYKALLVRLAQCLQNDYWPGISDEMEELWLPPWAVDDDEEKMELTIGGKSVKVGN